MQHTAAPTLLETLFSYPRLTLVYLAAMGLLALALIIPNEQFSGLEKCILVVAFLLEAVIAKLLVLVMRRVSKRKRPTWHDAKHLLAIFAAMIFVVAIAARPLSKTLDSTKVPNKDGQPVPTEY